MKKAIQDGVHPGGNSFFTNRDWSKGKTALSDGRIKASEHPRNETLKKWMIESGIPKKCKWCGITEWRDLPLSLELDHINGDSTDNRLENLRFLCPNCHSQTPTYRSKNIKSRKKVPDEMLLEALNSSKTIADALRKVGLSPRGGNYARCYKLGQVTGIGIPQ